MIVGMKKAFLLLLGVLLSAQTAFADDYAVRPFLMDVTLEPRETHSDIVRISNSNEYAKYLVYATVNEITIDSEGLIKEFVTPTMSERTNTVTSWIEVTRGRIEVPAGESREVPILFKINPNAQPGEYHAFVGFVRASNRPDAQKIAMDGDAEGVVVKITVPDDRKELLRVKSFSADRFVLSGKAGEAEVVLQNVGDLSVVPQGEVIFYDGRGVEVAAEMVNNDGVEIKPGETKTFYVSLLNDAGAGRYKANILLNYGTKQTASLHDSVNFYQIPLYALILLILLIIIISVSMTLLLKRAFSEDEHRVEPDEVTMFISDEKNHNPHDHDIDLSKKNAE